jgi:RHS repeat-associated protein
MAQGESAARSPAASFARLATATLARSMGALALLVLGALLPAQDINVSAGPDGRATRECCPPPSVGGPGAGGGGPTTGGSGGPSAPAPAGPSAGSGGPTTGGPTTGGPAGGTTASGGYLGSQPYQFVPPSLDERSVAVGFPLLSERLAKVQGVVGAANFYGKWVYARAEAPIDVLDQIDNFYPLPGLIVLTRDPVVASLGGGQTSGGVSGYPTPIMPEMVGSQSARGGANFSYVKTVGTTWVFRSDLSPATLWWHDPQAGSEGESDEHLEVRHTDGTIARFDFVESASSSGDTYGVWRLEQILDPYDNLVDYVYDLQGRLQKVVYPNGIEERWNHAPDPDDFDGWVGLGGTPSFLEITYVDTTLPTPTAISGISMGLVFDGPGQFRSPLRRIYYPAESFVERGGSSAVYDLASDELVGRPAYDISWTGTGEIAGVGQGFAITSGFPYPVSLGQGVRGQLTPLYSFVYSSGLLSSMTLGPRSNTYAPAPTQPTDPALARTRMIDADGNITDYDYETATNRIVRIEQSVPDNALNRPRKYGSSGLSLPSGAEQEPARIETVFTFGACGCEKPETVTVTAYDDLGTVLGSPRVSQYEYWPNGLLKKTIEPSSAGGGATLVREYEYTSAAAHAAGSGEPLNTGGILWSATVPSRIVESQGPSGPQFQERLFEYQWVSRQDGTNHGSMVQVSSSHVPAVTRQTGLTQTEVPPGSTGDVGVQQTFKVGATGTGLPGRLLSSIDADGVASSFTWDGYSYPASMTFGATTTSYTCDSWGRRSQIVVQDGASLAGSGAPLETTFAVTESPWGVLRQTTTTVGGVQHTSAGYPDRWGNLALQRVRNRDSANAAPSRHGSSSTTAREWIESHWIYNYFDLVDEYLDRRPVDEGSSGTLAGSVDARFLHRSFTLTNNGRVSEIANPNGSTTYVQTDGYGSFFSARTEASGTNPPSTWHQRVFVNHFLEPVAVVRGDGGTILTTTITREPGTGVPTSIVEPTAPLPPGSNYTSGTLGVTGGKLGGARWQIDYDGRGLATRVRAFDGSLELVDRSMAYDELGRLMRTADEVLLQLGGIPTPPAEHVRIWAYQAGRASLLAYTENTATTSTNERVTYTYDTHARLTQVLDAAGNHVDTEYHPGTTFPSAVTRSLVDSLSATVAYRTEFVVDEFGRTIERRVLGTSSAPLTYTYAYSSLGQTDKMVDPRGVTETMLHDAFGRVVEHARLGIPGASQPVTPSVATFTFEDTPGGSISRIVREDGLGNVSSQILDYMGRTVVEMMPGATTVPTAASPHQPFAKLFQYDEASRLRAIYDGDEGHVEYWFDGADRPILQGLVSNPAEPSQISDWVARDVLYRDVLGRPLGYASFGWNTAGNAVDTAVPVNSGTVQVDSLGRVRSSFAVPSPVGTNALAVVSEYDAGAMFRTGVQYLDGLATGSKPLRLGFDADAVGRLASVDWDHGSPGTLHGLATYGYQGEFAEHRVLQLSSVNTIETDRSFDAYGRLASILDSLDLNGTISSAGGFQYVYDDSSNLLEEVYVGGKLTSGEVADHFVPDDFNRLKTALLGVASGGGSQWKSVDYELDAAQNRSSVTQTKSGSSTTDVYSRATGTNRYSGVGPSGSQATILHDQRGNVIFDGHKSYKYDFKNRLVEVFDVVVTASMTASSLSAQSESASTPEVEAFAVLDPEGFRESCSTVSRRLGATLRQVLERSVNGTRDRVSENTSGEVVPIYAPGGGFDPTLTYVTTTTLVPRAVYNYDVFNRRVLRALIEDPLYPIYGYSWDGWSEAQEVQLVNDGTVQDPLYRWRPRQQYVWGEGLDELIAYRNVDVAPTEVFFLTHGGQDTSNRVYDEAGVLQYRVEYDAYGEVTASVVSPGVSNPRLAFLWKGMRVDPETGLGYRRNRYLNYKLGRFMSRDPIGDWGDGLNWGNGYGYVGSRPGIAGDPLGLQTRPIPGLHVTHPVERLEIELRLLGDAAIEQGDYPSPSNDATRNHPIHEVRYIYYENGQVLDLRHIITSAGYHWIAANCLGWGLELTQWWDGNPSGHPLGGNGDLTSNWIGGRINEQIRISRHMGRPCVPVSVVLSFISRRGRISFVSPTGTEDEPRFAPGATDLAPPEIPFA